MINIDQFVLRQTIEVLKKTVEDQKEMIGFLKKEIFDLQLQREIELIESLREEVDSD